MCPTHHWKKVHTDFIIGQNKLSQKAQLIFTNIHCTGCFTPVQAICQKKAAELKFVLNFNLWCKKAHWTDRDLNTIHVPEQPSTQGDGGEGVVSKEVLINVQTPDELDDNYQFILLLYNAISVELC